MKLNTSKITNFIQLRPILQRLVSTTLILVCCHSRIVNVQYSQKQYIRIFAHDKQYMCDYFNEKNLSSTLLFPKWDSSKKMFYPLYQSSFCSPVLAKKKCSKKKRILFQQFVADFKITPLQQPTPTNCYKKIYFRIQITFEKKNLHLYFAFIIF